MRTYERPLSPSLVRRDERAREPLQRERDRNPSTWLGNARPTGASASASAEGKRRPSVGPSVFLPPVRCSLALLPLPPGCFSVLLGYLFLSLSRSLTRFSPSLSTSPSLSLVVLLSSFSAFSLSFSLLLYAAPGLFPFSLFLSVRTPRTGLSTPDSLFSPVSRGS